MKFLVDHDVYAKTVRLLRGWGHDVVQVAQLGLSQAPDSELLRVARDDHRILVTRDRDFGALIVAGTASGGGVIFLRMLPSTVGVVHTELERVLTEHSEQELLTAFVVVEPGRHRIRRSLP